jgi:hypothetical protein
MPLGQFRSDLPQAHAVILQLASNRQYASRTLPALAFAAAVAAPWNAPGGVRGSPSALVARQPPSRLPRFLAASSASLVRC